MYENVGWVGWESQSMLNNVLALFSNEFKSAEKIYLELKEARKVIFKEE